MMIRSRTRARLLHATGAVLVLVLGLTACGSSSSGSKQSSSTTESASSGPVRGFDGTTVKLAGIGIKAQLPGSEWGARARIKRFNDTNEIKGVKLEYEEFVDDKFDPAVALSEVRRLVTQTKVFALVGDVTPVSPGAYTKEQHVPVFGYAFDNSYCSQEPDPTIWSFGFIGCVVPDNPKTLPDNLVELYDYASKELGTPHPTIALFNTDTASGHKSSDNALITLKGDGFDTLPALPIIPPPPVTDYTPFVQRILTSDHGHAPQVVACYAATDCVPMWLQMKAAGFKGIFYHTIYADQLVKPMAGTVVGVGWANFADPTPAVTQLSDDVKAVKADQGLDIGVAAGYFSTDMFISALKKAYAKDGAKGITPEKVRAAASTMTWEIKGLVGPTKYPESSVKPTPACGTLAKSDGTSWKTLIPFTCASRSFPVK